MWTCGVLSPTIQLVEVVAYLMRAYMPPKSLMPSGTPSTQEKTLQLREGEGGLTAGAPRKYLALEDQERTALGLPMLML